MGGLGGFFPPLLLGFFRDRFGVVWPGFILLARRRRRCGGSTRSVFLPPHEAAEAGLPPESIAHRITNARGAWATFMTGLARCAAIVVGSRNLQNFDAALVIYTFAIIFATWGVAYHYSVWLQKPPTRLYWRRAWNLLRKRKDSRGVGMHGANAPSRTSWLQTIHLQSGRVLRWWMHQLPLLGLPAGGRDHVPARLRLDHFGRAPDDQMTYVTYLFGFPVGSFRIRTVLSWLLFHGLDISAVLVLAASSLALWRRMRDQGALALQSFAMDFFPLILLFAISVTGLALTASTIWLRGNFYDFLAILHAITVIAALLYLPFGKFFHIFQRPAQLGVKLYQEAGSIGSGRTLRALRRALRLADAHRGFEARTAASWTSTTRCGPAGHWQDVCPALQAQGARDVPTAAEGGASWHGRRI